MHGQNHTDSPLFKFHPSKCYCIHIRENNEEEFTYSMTEDGNKFDVTKVNDMKDIGVTLEIELKFEQQN